MVMVAVCPQWREAGMGERELGRSLLQGMGQKGSSKLTWHGGCEWGGPWGQGCSPRSTPLPAKRPPALPASPAFTFSPLSLTHHAGG